MCGCPLLSWQVVDGKDKMRQDTFPRPTSLKESEPRATRRRRPHHSQTDGTASRPSVRRAPGNPAIWPRRPHIGSPRTQPLSAKSSFQARHRRPPAPQQLSVRVGACFFGRGRHGKGRSHVNDDHGPGTVTIPTATGQNAWPVLRPITAVRILRCECVARKHAASSILRKRQQPSVVGRKGKSSSSLAPRPSRA